MINKQRQWKALIGACLLQCAMLGVLINCTGVLFAQIRAETGIRMTEISAYNTLKCITGALLSASVTGLFFRKNQKTALLVNQIMLCTGYLLMMIQPGGAIWYFAAAIAGVSGCLGVVAVPSILSRIFPQKSGTPTGIAMAFSGIGGAIFNPLCAKLIAAVGLLGATSILCLIDLSLSIIGILLLFSEVDAQPRLSKEFHNRKQTQKGARFDWAHCIPVTIVLVCNGFGFQLATNLSIFAQSLGYPLRVGASLTTMLMLGNVAGKFLYGFLCDRIGVWKATALGLGCVIAGTLVFLLFSQNLALLYVAALLFGSIYSLSTISISRCCMAAYGEDNYTRYIGIHTGINHAVTAIVSMVTGVIIDKTGSFSLILISVLIGALLSLSGVWALRKTGTQKFSLQSSGQECGSSV